MTRTILSGLDGTNPLGFMGSLGLLRVLHLKTPAVRLRFMSDGSFHPFIEGLADTFDLADAVATDAAEAAEKPAWLLEYPKEEKKGIKMVADLKAPPAAFAGFLSACIELWLKGDDEDVAFAAAFGTTVAVDGNGNTKPTAFHFTAANQQFLGTVQTIRAVVTAEWARRSLFEGHATLPGGNLRWDPAAERNWALMANNPNDDGTSVDAPLEWLAFRSLPLFPSFPVGSRIITTAVRGRGDDMKMTWPLCSLPISLETAASALQAPMVSNGRS